MRIVTDAMGRNPRILDKKGDDISQGFSSISMFISNDQTRAELVLCAYPLQTDVEPSSIRIQIAHPVTGDYMDVKSIQFEDGSEWKVSDHA